MKRFNLDQFIWFSILAILSMILIFLFGSGKLFLLINSERKISMAFMVVFMILLSVIQITRVFTIPSRDGVKGGYIQFVILIMILILVSNIDITEISLKMRGVKLYHSEHNHNHDNHSHGLIEVSENLELDSENFHGFVEEISAHLDSSIGKEIKLEGIYYYDNKYPDKFIVTQLEMNCCIADSEYLGVLCDGDIELDQYKIGDKIKVTGKIDSFTDGDKKFMKLEVINLE